MNTRKRHSPEFKAKVALEAVKNLQTVNEIAAKFQIHPAQVSQWKGELQKNMTSIFDKGGARRQEKELEELHQLIGKLTIENEWIKKKLVI